MPPLRSRRPGRRRRAQRPLYARSARVREPAFLPLNEETRRLADRLPVVVYAGPSGITGAFTFVSAGIEHMLGYPRQDWVENPKMWLSLIHPDDRWHVVRVLSPDDWKRHRLSYRIRDAGGTWRLIEDTVWRDIADGWTVGVWTDLTEARRREQALSEARREALRLRRHLVRLMMAASHTLRTPARQIVSLSDIMARRGVDLGVSTLLSTLRESASAIERRLALLAAYAEAVLRAPRIEDVSCDAAFRDALSDEDSLIRETRAVVTYDPLPLVHADAERLRNVLRRLLDNAMRHGGPKPRVHVFAQRHGPHWVISVRDHGSGISQARLKWLFAPFDASERKPEGLGPCLGLAICREYVESHGGELWAASEPGVGSTFSFSAPCAFVEEGF